MSGKGSNRRRENTAAVEANWPSHWDVREQEQDGAWQPPNDDAPIRSIWTRQANLEPLTDEP